MNNIEILNKDELIELQDNLKEYSDYTEEIKECSEDIINSYFTIGNLLNEINDRKLYELEEYNDIYEYAEDKFGYKITSVKNMMSVYSKYKNDNGSCLSSEFKDFSYTALVELLPVENSLIKNEYNPDMSIKQIRSTKKINQLTDILKQLVIKADSIVEIVKNCINVANSKILNKKAFIEIKEHFRNLNDVSFLSYAYCLNIKNRNYYRGISWCDIKINNEEFKVIYSFQNLDLTNMSLDEVKKYFDDLFDKYIISANEDFKKTEIRKEEKKQIDKLPYKLINLNDYSGLPLFIVRIFLFIKSVILYEVDKEYDCYSYQIYIQFYSEEHKYVLPLYFDDSEVAYIEVLIEDDHEVPNFNISLLDINKNVIASYLLNDENKVSCLVIIFNKISALIKGLKNE